nr:hypothetical protein Itr_chr05CG22300 [Ipomoea trifida]
MAYCIGERDEAVAGGGTGPGPAVAAAAVDGNGTGGAEVGGALAGRCQYWRYFRYPINASSSKYRFWAKSV